MIIIKKFLSIVLIVAIALALLCSCGPKIKNGFVNKNGYTYYYVNNEMWTGRKEIDGDWYYFGQNGEVPPEQVGAMCKNFAMGYEGYDETYYYGSDGKMVKNEFVLINGKKFYCGNDGNMLRDTQKEINGEIYNFDSDGVATRVPGTRALTLFGHYKIIENKWTEISDEKEIILIGNSGRKCRLTNFTRPYPWEWNCNIEFLGNEEINRYTVLPFAFVSDEFYSFGEMHFEWVNRISDREFKISAKNYSIDDKDRNFIIEFMY